VESQKKKKKKQHKKKTPLPHTDYITKGAKII
jgi:hypothetical protein